MVGSSLGTIEQAFATSVGERYSLTFFYANNPVPNITVDALVEVLGNATLLSETIEHSNSTSSDMNYLPFSAELTADSSTTTLRFTATSRAGNAGIVLDSVGVDLVPEPSTAILAIFGLFGVVAMRRR